MKFKELFSRAFFYTRLGYSSYLNWWIGAIAYITIIYELGNALVQCISAPCYKFRIYWLAFCICEIISV